MREPAKGGHDVGLLVRLGEEQAFSRQVDVACVELPGRDDDDDVGAGLEDAHGLVRVGRYDCDEAGILDPIDGCNPQERIVFDDEDGWPGSLPGWTFAILGTLQAGQRRLEFGL